MTKKTQRADVIDLQPVTIDGDEVFVSPGATERPRASLDALRGIMLGSQASAAGLPVAVPAASVQVDSDGQIHLVDESDRDSPTRRHLSEVTTETFASRGRPSLDAIRDQVRGAQQRGEVAPAAPREKVVVDREGNIGFEADLADGRPLSEVSQETFAASRLEKDREVVAAFLPATTTEAAVDGTVGWRYSFVNEFNDRFVMWAFFDGFQYQVVLVSPEAEDVARQHDQHLFRDGYLCLSPSGGTRTLQRAWSRSVLWANGYSAYRHTGKFPFSINNF